MKKEKYILILIFILPIFFGLFYYLKISKENAPLNELKAIEIKEYKGENLSSITSFRENSIKGPQHINRESYQLKIYGLVNEEKKLSYDDIIKGLCGIK